MRMGRIVLTAVIAAALAGCGGGDGAGDREPAGTLTIAVNAPFSRASSLGATLAHGAELAARQINQAGGVATGDGTFRLVVERLDSRLAPEQAVRNVRRAVAAHAVAVIDEGTGVDASWRIAAEADLPVGITYQGGMGLVDPRERPNVFRIAPTDRGISFRLAEYLIPKGLRVALMHDDSGYGQQGGAALQKAFADDPQAVAARLDLPAGATDLAPQVLRARRARATALLVWAQPATIAGVVAAARRMGWDVPVFTPSAGGDPLVRQQLSAHPEWVDGLTFAAGRMTAEVGPGPFTEFATAYEAAYGPDEVGVRAPDGRKVVQPPEVAMYSYDFVNVVVAAIERAGSRDPEKVLAALEQVDVRGANGDERGFNETSHEGVVDDDVYFARFDGMTFAPVPDDPLSASLPVIEQRR